MGATWPQSTLIHMGWAHPVVTRAPFGPEKLMVEMIIILFVIHDIYKNNENNKKIIVVVCKK